MLIQPIWDGQTCQIAFLPALLEAAPNIISAGLQIGSALTGSRERREGADAAADAARRARRRAENFQRDLLNIQKQLLEEGRTLREARNEASIRATQRLEQEAAREPGTSQFFTRGFEAGTEQFAETLAAQGLGPDTSVFGEFAGELGGSLLATEEQRRLDIDRLLTSQAIDPSQLAPSFGAQALGAEGLIQQALSSEAEINLAQSTLPTTGQTVTGGLTSLLQSNPELITSLLGSLFRGRGGTPAVGGAGRAVNQGAPLIGFEEQPFSPGQFSGDFFQLEGEAGSELERIRQLLFQLENPNTRT